MHQHTSIMYLNLLKIFFTGAPGDRMHEFCSVLLVYTAYAAHTRLAKVIDIEN